MKNAIVTVFVLSLFIIGCTKTQSEVIMPDVAPPPSCFDETGELTFDPAAPLPRDCAFGWSILDFAVILPQGWKLWPDGLPALYRADTGQYDKANRLAMIIYMSDTDKDAGTWWEQCENFSHLTAGKPSGADSMIFKDDAACDFRFIRNSYGHQLSCSFIGRRLDQATKQFFFVMACGSDEEYAAFARADGYRMVLSAKAVTPTVGQAVTVMSSSSVPTQPIPQDWWK